MLERASRSFSSHTSRLGIEWPLRDPGWRCTFHFFFFFPRLRQTDCFTSSFSSHLLNFLSFPSSSHPHSLRFITLPPSPFLDTFPPIPILKSNPLPITAHQYVSGPSFDPAWQFQRNIGLRRLRPWARPDFPSLVHSEGLPSSPSRIFASREFRKRDLES